MDQLETKYNELRPQVEECAIQLSKLDKENYLLDETFTIIVGKYQDEQLSIMLETTRMKRCMELYKEGKPLKEIPAMVNQELAPNVQKHVAYKRKIQTSEMHEKELKKLTKDDMLEVEKIYEKICRKYHPIVKGALKEIDLQTWKVIDFAYKTNNIQALRGFENSTIIEEAKYNPDNAEKVIANYELNIKNFQPQVEKILKNYPQTIKPIVSDEIEINKVIAKYREDNYQMREKMNQLQKEFDAIFAQTDAPQEA